MSEASRKLEDVTSWKVFEYGSQHIVFKYTGVVCEDYKSKILRVRIKSTYVTGQRIANLEKLLLEYVCKKYLMGGYLLEASVVCLGTDELTYIQEQVNQIEKFKNSILYDHALLSTNIYGLSSKVFELKPKWHGCKTSAKSHQLHQCPYCSHQKRYRDQSQYCPSLLFSPSKDDLHLAVARYPFKNLSSDLHHTIISNILYHDGILRILNELHDHNCFIGSLLKADDYSLSELAYLQQLEEHIDGMSQSLVAEFLITFALKDCSLFIVIDDDIQESHKKVIMDGNVLTYSIYVIDVDIKPICRLERYIAKNKIACQDRNHLIG